MTWIQRLRHQREMEQQLDKELLFHLEQHTNDLIASGVPPKEARRQANLDLGGPQQVRESCRDARGTRWLSDLWQDLRYALRTLHQNPGFAAVALLTLALGTGATTVMFTVINGVLLKPLPYAQPDRLVRLFERTNWSTQWGNVWGYTYPNFVDCKRDSRSLDLIARRWNRGTVTSPGEPEHVDGFEISADLFSVLGVSPVIGRTFRSDEDRLGAEPVVIISHAIWESRFGGSSDAIGKPLVFEGVSYTIIGVAPAGFRLADAEADLYTLIGQDPSPRLRDREMHGVMVWGRLRPGATLAKAQTELAMIGRNLEAQYPKSNKGRTFVAEPLRLEVGTVRSTLWLLLGAVSLVLLIACANIASLLLARAISRERELAMRVALGAGRGRLARQCLTESTVLAFGGGLLGIAIAAVGLRPFVAFWPGNLPRAEEVHIDWHVLLFTLGVSLLSGLLFGLAPALRAPSRTLEQSLRTGSRTVAGSSRRLHAGFVIAEIALAVVLLVAAGMLGRTLLRLSALNPGVNVHNVLTTRTGFSSRILADPARTRAAWNDLLDRVRRVPGVQSVAAVDTVPMREGNNEVGYYTTPTAPPADQQPLALANSVTPDYLKVMGLALRQGRFFNDQDHLGSEGVVVIDEVMAKQAFGHERAVGRHLWIGMGSDPVRVIGVVDHVRYWGLAGDDQAQVRAQFYYPFAQVPDKWVRRWSELMSIAIRTSVDPLSIVEPLRRAVGGLSGDEVSYEVNTMEQLASASLARQRFLVLLFGMFAGLALLLACIGIYGVLAYLTSQRVPEIGVRMALGARAGNVIWLVLRQSLAMVIAGIAVGTAAALGGARILEKLVEGMQPNAPSTFALMLPLLVSAALAASFVPALRASRVDPIQSLRQE